MAGAPIKLGLKYGYLDTEFHHDENFEKLRIAFGPKSTTFYLLLRNYIFVKRGYYLQYTDDNVENFLAWSKHTPWFNKQNLSEFISTAIRYGIFDKYIFETFGVLTSESIQITWNFATKNRLIRYIVVDYWLLASRQVDKRELLKDQILQNKTKVTLYIEKEDIDYVENLIRERATYSNEELSNEDLGEKELPAQNPKESKISYEQFLQKKRYEGQSFTDRVRCSSAKYYDAPATEVWKMFTIFCNKQITCEAKPDEESKLLVHFFNWLEKTRPSTLKPKNNEKPKPTQNSSPRVGRVANQPENNADFEYRDIL